MRRGAHAIQGDCADVTARDERFGTTALEWAKLGEHDAVSDHLEAVMEDGEHPGE